MKLVGSTTSPFVRKIRVQLQEKEIPFEFVLENVWDEETRIADHNPLGKVPCLILDGGQTVFDSTVISGMLEYMMPTVPLLPTDPRLRALVRTMEALGTGISEAAVGTIVEKRFHTEGQISQAFIDRQVQKIHNALGWISHRIKTTPGFYLTEQFSLADISVGCSLFYLDLRMPEINWRELYPELKEYSERLACRPSFENTKPE
ncbi:MULTISPECIES: glutathione S-transferase C-terminal domain-containing protein [Limnobacter]|uniref:Glutathione S-transferase n=1 Tax=Limnobacter litoralis TaxID=481366 RepID=A0ABQ5YKU5_9BURK|nr:MULTISPECIES: glutathione S-transferase C-terminal domain-containing protein [Limnobacter]GLR25160.1 glutathione S-transferase [Limnobacter litoralis]